MCDQRYKEVPWDQRGPSMLAGFDKDGNRVALKPMTAVEALISPFIDRTYAVLQRHGLIPKNPSPMTAESLPKYDEIWVVCRCGQKIGGTILRDQPFEFNCLHCRHTWTGTLKFGYRQPAHGR